jgi:hypothetical protein
MNSICTKKIFGDVCYRIDVQIAEEFGEDSFFEKINEELETITYDWSNLILEELEFNEKFY